MSEKGIVLLVEDNEKIQRANRRILEDDGHEVLTAATLAEARECLASSAPDVVVLDIMMPDGSGLDFLGELRKTCAAPVLFLTAKVERDDVLGGLRAGGNDYITKPYDIDEFRERVAAFMRLARDMRHPPRKIRLGEMELDILSNRAFLKGRDMLLSQKEFGALLFLARNEERNISAEELYEAVWGAGLEGDATALRSAISRLRVKLADGGYRILAERGIGYRLEKR
jgi:DNA-binding response OmpR family regulator